MSDYPEHEKLHAVKDKSQAIGEFIHWLAETHDAHVITYECDYDGRWERRRGAEGRWMRERLAEFFNIDLAKIEDEKDAMLAELRKETT